MSTDDVFKFRPMFKFILNHRLSSTSDYCSLSTFLLKISSLGKNKKVILWLFFCVCTQTTIYNALFTSHPCEVPIPRLPIGPFGFHSQRALQAAVGATSVYIHNTVIETGFVSDKFLAFISLVVYLLPPSSSMADAPCFWLLLGLWCSVDWRDEIIFFIRGRGGIFKIVIRQLLLLLYYWTTISS